MDVKHVACAVRGGPESRATVTKAIDLALERGARLTFVHVMDADFLGYATIGPLSVVYRELAEMGNFMMMILRDRAVRRGVKEVGYVLMEGNIRKRLRDFARETDAGLLVMGRPVRSPGSNVFREEEIESFADVLRKESGMEVMLVSA
jgi:nucleotide-binding universal stress UspA family protein